jgi:transcriptional regulator with XRE-family HTH domain
MPTNRSKSDDPKFEKAYYRAMLRSAFMSMFWAVISDRKRQGLTLISLAKAIGSSKHEVSRWFNGDPNWTINTIAAIAHALKLKLVVQAIDEHGNIYGSSGIQSPPAKTPIATSGVIMERSNVTRKPPGASVIRSDIASSEKVA